jgi:hypothetical protein
VASVLREMVDLARREAGLTLSDMTVLTRSNDPVRVDTDAGHREGQWFRDNVRRFYRGSTLFHLRGLHYRLVVVSALKPDGSTYENTHDDWKWLAGPAKAARWLGYVPFDRFVDHRNNAPEVVEHKPPVPVAWCQTDAVVPEITEIDFEVTISGFEALQPWQIVIFGEKNSLKESLMHFHENYGCDLYVGACETSDTLIYNMASKAAADGRPLAVLCIADFDPSGHQMSISIAWKLELLRLLEFPELRFHVVRVGLTLEQAIHYRLPSTPLKESEKRADRWQREHGREQTKIDALLELHPDALHDTVLEAVLKYFDDTLNARVREARVAWLVVAQETVEAETEDKAEPLRRQAEQAMETLEEAVEALDGIAYEVRSSDILPEIEIPQAELDEPDDSDILATSDWPFAELARKLKQEKAYGEDDS